MIGIAELCKYVAMCVFKFLRIVEWKGVVNCVVPLNFYRLHISHTAGGLFLTYKSFLCVYVID